MWPKRQVWFSKKSFAGCIVIVVKYSVETPSVNDMSLKAYFRSAYGKDGEKLACSYGKCLLNAGQF